MPIASRRVNRPTSWLIMPRPMLAIASCSAVGVAAAGQADRQLERDRAEKDRGGQDDDLRGRSWPSMIGQGHAASGAARPRAARDDQALVHRTAAESLAVRLRCAQPHRHDHSTSISSRQTARGGPCRCSNDRRRRLARLRTLASLPTMICRRLPSVCAVIADMPSHQDAAEVAATVVPLAPAGADAVVEEAHEAATPHRARAGTGKLRGDRQAR